jgi:hypothetical protein
LIVPQLSPDRRCSCQTASRPQRLQIRRSGEVGGAGPLGLGCGLHGPRHRSNDPRRVRHVPAARDRRDEGRAGHPRARADCRGRRDPEAPLLRVLRHRPRPLAARARCRHAPSRGRLHEHLRPLHRGRTRGTSAMRSRSSRRASRPSTRRRTAMRCASSRRRSARSWSARRCPPSSRRPALWRCRRGRSSLDRQ